MEKTWLDTTIREDDATTTREISRANQENQMSFANVEMKVIQWGEARGIVQNSTAFAQATKTQEELNELFEAIESGDREAMADAYGDILVTLIMGCACADLDLLECLKGAYEEIKDRKGYLSKEGLFIKQ
jgi:NTP pyrophosphatase (non-canonical NTP hydrolase)